MAQPVFDDGPIEQYLRESGEVSELMPGGTVEFSVESVQEDSKDSYYSLILGQFLSGLVRTLPKAVLHAFDAAGWRSHSPASEFAERFKYIVISSSLLSSSLASSLPGRAGTPTTPGHYEPSTAPFKAASPPMSTTPNSSTSLLTAFLAFLIPVALAQGYYISGVLMLAAVKMCFHCNLSPASLASSRGEDPWSTTLDSLEMLVSASDTWDSIVGEVLMILENEERNFSHPPSSSSPSASLRIGLSSSLYTTQTQCDNVRQLFSALTSPIVLSQLSEMYAPPSPPPIHNSFSPRPSFPQSITLDTPCLHRSSSCTHAKRDGTLVRTGQFSAPAGKRATWNGSYMSLTDLAHCQQKRRSELLVMDHRGSIELSVEQNVRSSSSVPITPSQPSIDAQVAGDVGEDTDAEEEPFGVIALGLHRKQHNRRSLLFEGPPQSLAPLRAPSILGSAHGSPLSSSFGSRLTSFSSTASPSRRSPVSLSNLHLALHGALAARRFACAHLLALRFRDPRRPEGGDTDCEDESYWEDVRSIMALLTSTLEDASARLSSVLAEATRPTDTVESVPTSPPPATLPPAPQSFAPVPSHLSRFTVHVDAISAALDEARRHLQASVASLHDGMPAALEPLELVRRELGLALRECERGRGTLLEIVRRDPADAGAVVGGVEGGGRGEDGEPMRRDEQQLSSGESDQTLFNMDEHSEAKGGVPEVPAPLQEFVTSGVQAPAYDSDGDGDGNDDAGAGAHLPPRGLEQVFESVSGAAGAGLFSRERAKLARGERIRLARARRESAREGSGATLVSGDGDGSGDAARQRGEVWGPGGEVVQELKDVIWRVGEQRRKMVEQSSSGRPPPAGPD